MTDRMREFLFGPFGEKSAAEEADASSNSAANEGADYVIADAIRRRIPDFRMPELMAWDIIRALEQASLTIGRSIPNRVQAAANALVNTADESDPHDTGYNPNCDCRDCRYVRSSTALAAEEEGRSVGTGRAPDESGRASSGANPSHATPKRAAKLHGKYFGLRRTRDGSEVEGFYFVLREDDPHAQAALEAYATSCEAEAPELAADLRGVVKDAQTLQGLHDAGWER